MINVSFNIMLYIIQFVCAMQANNSQHDVISKEVNLMLKYVKIFGSLQFINGQF